MSDVSPTTPRSIPLDITPHGNTRQTRDEEWHYKVPCRRAPLVTSAGRTRREAAAERKKFPKMLWRRTGGSAPRRVWASHYISPSKARISVPVLVTRCFWCRKKMIYRSFVDAIKSSIELRLIWVNAYVVLKAAGGRVGHLLLETHSDMMTAFHR